MSLKKKAQSIVRRVRRQPSGWKRIRIYVREDLLGDHETFCREVFLDICQFQDTVEGVGDLYYARYSNRKANYVDIRAVTKIGTKAAWDWWRNVTWAVEVRVRDVGAGSKAHAKAFTAVREMHGKGEELTLDVFHWMLNQLGYTYGHELLFYQERAVQMTKKLLGYK